LLRHYIPFSDHKLHLNDVT